MAEVTLKIQVAQSKEDISMCGFLLAQGLDPGAEDMLLSQFASGFGVSGST